MTRNPRMIAHGIALLAITAGLIWLGWTRGGWWELLWIGAVLAGITAAGDITDGFTRRDREDDGYDEPEETQ